VKERPILFQGEMIRALLAGTKVQTRRALKPQPPVHTVAVGTWHDPGPRLAYWAWTREGPPDRESFTAGAAIEGIKNGDPLTCPYGDPGDQLWVRESLKPWTHDPELFAYAADDARVQADGYNYPVKPGRPYVPSIHLARCWSRITLEVTAVRVERLWEISDADVRAEGCEGTKLSYAKLWERINGAGSWDANPWVWVIEFKRVTDGVGETSAAPEAPVTRNGEA
jgi:hypothetical protein